VRTLLHTPRARRTSLATATLGAIALVGSLLVATPAQALNDTGSGGVFTPTAGRILDTKNNIGGYSTPMVANEWRTIKVAGLADVPDDGTVGAVSLVATVADIPDQAILYGRPDSSQPTTSMGIYGGIDNDNTSFSSVLAVSSSGTIQVRTQNAVRLILDVQGYYTSNEDGLAPGGFVPLNGKRIVDTRSGAGAPKGTLASGASTDVQVAGVAGVPKGASAAIVNLIAINTTSAVGYLTPYATGATRPSTSLNYAGGTTTSMQAQVPLSADGKITIYNRLSTTNLVVDVQGYFTAAGKTGAAFTPGAGRVYDSRDTGNKIVGAQETRAIQVAGQAGVPVMGSGISAVVLSLTVAHGGGVNGGYARVWANGASEPDSSSINYDFDTIRTNTITVPLGANGKINLHNIGEATNYVFDVQGWYSNPSVPTISCPAAYKAGAWMLHADGSDVGCTVTAAASVDSESLLFTLVDGIPIETRALSETVKTNIPLTVPGTPGWHELTAITMFANGDSETQELSFGLNSVQPSATLSAIEKAAPEALSDLSTIATTAAGPVAIQTNDDVAVTVPTSAIDGITLTPSAEEAITSTPLSADLPFADAAAGAVVEANGIISYDNRNDTSSVPIVHGDGSVQVATVIKSASAPNRFVYPLDIPTDSIIKIGENGSLVITDSLGGFLGAMDAPWAKDANGQSVPTHYEVTGNVVTQVVDVTATSAFPVVADPDLWTTIKNVAGCALDIASFALPAAKLAKAFAKAEKVIKASKAAIKAYKTLGGKMDKLIKLLQKYVKNKSSLSKTQIAALTTFIGAVGASIFNLLGLGNCLELAKQIKG
jgi:hypothetical protein